MNFILLKLAFLLSSVLVNCSVISNQIAIDNEIKDEIKLLKDAKEKTEFTNFINIARKHFGTCGILESYKKINNKVSSVKTGECADPSETDMMINLVKLTFYFKELSGVLDLDSVQEIYQHLIIQKKPTLLKNTISYGETSCYDDYSDLNMTKINEMAICPWHTKVVTRKDRYPSVVLHTVCNCEKCQRVNTENEDVAYKCQPVYKLSPALIKSHKCNTDTNVYEWIPALEKIAVACVCANTIPRVIF